MDGAHHLGIPEHCLTLCPVVLLPHLVSLHFPHQQGLGGVVVSSSTADRVSEKVRASEQWTEGERVHVFLVVHTSPSSITGTKPPVFLLSNLSLPSVMSAPHQLT